VAGVEELGDDELAFLPEPPVTTMRPMLVIMVGWGVLDYGVVV